MQEIFNYSLTKNYLKNGDVPEEDSSDLSFSQLQALVLRREARLAKEDGNTEEATALRHKSREVLERSVDVLDFTVLEHISTAKEVDLDFVLDFLESLNLKTLPILSNTPEDIKALFAQRFNFELISPDQIGLTDFDSIITESEVPEAIRQLPIVREKKDTTFLESLQSRWFLILIVLLAVFSAVGFSLDWSLGAENIIGPLDLYFSIYGITAVSRAGWQIKRAEQWNKHARNLVRSEYVTSLENLTHGIPELEQQRQLFEEAHKITGKKLTWDTYQEQLGLSENKKNKKKKSVIDGVAEHIGGDVTREMITDEIAKDIIERKFGKNPPSVGIVIPTYKTTLQEMSDLLRSIKQQVYPVGDVYLVYNDNPNDEDLSKRPAKQEEFQNLQALVDQVNGEEGNNNCTIKLLAQPSRGKREAMAMGFALSCGEKYLNVKHPEAEIANLGHIPRKSHDYTLNIDSDTRIADKYALLNSMLMMTDTSRGDISALTGDVRVINRDVNLLSEMTYQRYKRAFFVERAAQALSGDVTCLSGPWVLIKNDDLAEILDAWYYQEFLGQRSTYGDDRNISTLLNERGKNVVFCPDSAVETDCPTDWKTFLKQQLRWNKSFNRENIRLFPVLQNLDKFVQLDVVYQQTFAFAMLYILASIGGDAVMTGLENGALEGLKTTIPYATIVLIYNELFFGLYGALTNDKDLKFFLSPVYIGYHFTALIWLKIYAFFKMKDTTWGTKGADQDVIVEEFEQVKDSIISEIVDELKRDLPHEDREEE